MKLVRYGRPGRERPGLIDTDGKLRSLADVVDDIDAAALAPRSLAKLAKLRPEKLPLVRGRPRMGVPVGGVRKFLAVGLNYADHAAEAGMPIPEEPILFTKATSCLQGPDDDVMLPRGSTKTDWEVELGLVIGTTARNVPVRGALEYVAGYTVVNDVSEREFQLERGGSWDKGKGCDTFGPVGPWLVTRDEVPDPQKLGLWLDLNGEPAQRGTTGNMIFKCANLVSYISRFITLEPGDIIATGTPPGVGSGRKPPRFLKAGDVMTLGIAGLGEQCQRVVRYRKAP